MLMGQMRVQHVDRDTPQKRVQTPEILQPAPRMKMGIEMQALDQRYRRLAGQVFDLASRGHPEDDAVSTLKQALHQCKGGLRRTGPPTIAQEVQDGQYRHLQARSSNSV
jgi:hypothetical protein